MLRPSCSKTFFLLKITVLLTFSRSLNWATLVAGTENSIALSTLGHNAVSKPEPLVRFKLCRMIPAQHSPSFFNFCTFRKIHCWLNLCFSANIRIVTGGSHIIMSRTIASFRCGSKPLSYRTIAPVVCIPSDCSRRTLSYTAIRFAPCFVASSLVVCAGTEN